MPVAVAVFFTSPALISAWVTVYVAVAVPIAAGANVLGVTAKAVKLSLASAIVTVLNGTFPVFVTVNV